MIELIKYGTNILSGAGPTTRIAAIRKEKVTMCVIFKSSLLQISCCLINHFQKFFWIVDTMKIG